MSSNKLDFKELILKCNTAEMNPAQIRLIKSIHSMLSTVLTTENEEEYFETSKNLMMLVSNVIEKSNFATVFTTGEKIPYAKQALEFSLDFVSEEIYSGNVSKHDN